jgi:hypothetical protein
VRYHVAPNYWTLHLPLEGTTSEVYLNTLVNLVFPRTAAESDDLILQQDGAPAHFGVDVSTSLDERSLGRWIGLFQTVWFPCPSQHTLQCMRLTDHNAINFNNNMSTAAVFLDIEKGFESKWHLGMLYKISKIIIFGQSNKLASSFLFQKIQSLGRMSTPRSI